MRRQTPIPDDAPRLTEEGVVERVNFANEESGFRILRMRVGGSSRTWVGEMPSVAVGETARATGVEVADPKFGPQLRVITMVPVMPSSTDGLEKYLASGVIPGIAAGLAKKIVKRFGERTVEVLDTAPERLKEIRGIGAEKRDAIKAAWAEQRAVMEIMVFLQEHGASPALAKKIHKRFKDDAARVVRASPYRLAIEVHGIGFAIADRIARSVGIAQDSPERAQAGVLHQLNEMAGDGHVYAEREALAIATARMLEVDLLLVEDAIAALDQAGHVEVEQGRVSARKLHCAEARLAKRLRTLLDAGRGTDLSAHVAAAIESFEKAKGVQLAPEQREAIATAARARVVVITGGPGVGKTTILRVLLELFDRAKLAVRLSAPTGRAAKRMSETTSRPAVTIHRLLEFNPMLGGFQRTGNHPIEADVVVADEASMIDVLLADHLLDAVPEGARLVLVGDVDQLPSVGPGSVLRDIIDSGEVPTVRLTRIFRQAAGSAIVENAHRINRGEKPVGDASPDGEFFIIERGEADEAAASIVEMVTRRIPERFGLHPVRDVQVLSPMHKGAAGVGALNERLQELLNPQGEELKRAGRIYRVGDKVMQLRNDYEREVWNGDIGYVLSVDPADGELVVKVDDRDVKYAGAQLDDLTLAYATSIHKSQGGEFPCVVMAMLKSHWIMLARNLLYTGVTRGKRLVVLVTDGRALGQAVRETGREARRTWLAQRLKA